LTTSRHRFDHARQRVELRQQPMLDLDCGGDVHRCRKRIVGRLRHVDVIVRMHRIFAAEVSAQQLDRAIRKHFVDIHVRLRAGSGLPDTHRELVIQLPR
jgi:hypothetical protein